MAFKDFRQDIPSQELNLGPSASQAEPRPSPQYLPAGRVLLSKPASRKGDKCFPALIYSLAFMMNMGWGGSSPEEEKLSPCCGPVKVPPAPLFTCLRWPPEALMQEIFPSGQEYGDQLRLSSCNPLHPSPFAMLAGADWS